MRCDQFEAHETGAMTAEEFARHIRDCSECREQAALDERLDREIALLRHPVDAGPVWVRIEKSLAEEKARRAREGERPEPERRKRIVFFTRRWPLFVPAGTALLILGVLGIGLFRKAASPSGLLARDALAKIEITEREYRYAIDALERQARPKIAAMDLQMMSLYKDKLAAIDAQIDKCRDALAGNPANAHIQRYLLAALQDKKQTLADVLGLRN
jgi:anti-sigma factor RsiW